MPKHPWRFIWASLFIAWAFDFLFWKKTMGISFPIWVLLALVAGFGLAIGEGVRPARLSYLLGALVIGAALLTFIRAEPLTRFVNILLSILGLGMLAATLKTGNWVHYRFTDHLVAGFYLIAGAFTRMPELLGKKAALTEGEGSETEGEQEPAWRVMGKQALPVLRGLLIALPIVLILGGLLASADLIFKEWMTDFFSFIDFKRIPEYIFRLFYIVFILAYLLAGIFVHTVKPKQEVGRPEREKTWFKPFLGWVESLIVLVSVDLLFLIFVFIQFRYLFGGEANISETGFTYSEYARRGFGELVAVAILSLILHLALAGISRRETKGQRMTFSGLAVTLLALVLVMLASAMQRLYLYENAYGFTRLRTYPHVYIIWLGALLVATILLELTRQRGRFALALFVTVVGFCITLGALNVDGFIARQNVMRVYAGYELDDNYLKSLSSDAVPVMVDLYLSEGLPEKVVDKLGAELSCRTSMMEDEAGEESWQSYHLAASSARAWLDAYRSTWETKYPTVKDEYGNWRLVGEYDNVLCAYDLWGFD